MTRLGRAILALALLLASACATARADPASSAAEETGTAPADPSLSAPEGPDAAYIPGEVIVRLTPGAEPPSQVGPFFCTVAVAGSATMVLLRCTDDAGDLAPLMPLREALEAHPSVQGTEPNWVRGH